MARALTFQNFTQVALHLGFAYCTLGRTDDARRHLQQQKF